MSRRLLLFILIFLTLGFSNLFGQIIPPNTGESEKPDIRVGTDYSLLPIAGYTSDWGVFGGLFLQRINYGTNVKPFLSKIKTNFTASTKGTVISELEYERTRTFGTNIRSLVEFVGQRYRQDHYFGIGNQTEFSNKLYDGDYFYYENRQFSVFYQARKTAAKFGEFGQFDLKTSLDFSYQNSISRGEETRFEEDAPLGLGKNWSNKAGFGFVLDSRNNEFSPTRGLRYEASFQVSASIIGSEYTYSDFSLDMRHFFNLPGSIVLAHNLQFESIQGEAPFWDLAVIGGEDGLRGYHLFRFRGDQSVMNLLELRSWVFSLWNDEIRLGGQLFWDTGRVFSDQDSNDFFDNWKHSYGAGGVVSLFNPDLIFRMDIGFSDETYRIHFGAGYVF